MVARASGRGAFIVFEGVDRSGKSTQSQKLVDKLRASGIDAELWRFPDRSSAIGQMINSYLTSKSELDDAAVHLLFSANRWEKRQLMLSKLHSGTTLIVDRYAFSGAVFTAAKQMPGLDLEWAKVGTFKKAPDKGLPAPDAVLYLDLSVEAAAQRGGFGNERYENEEMQHEVRRLYSVLQKAVPGWTMLDAAQPVDTLNQQIVDIAQRVIAMCANEEPPLPALWTGKRPLEK